MTLDEQDRKDIIDGLDRAIGDLIDRMESENDYTGDELTAANQRIERWTDLQLRLLSDV